jgi:MoxR-like ATPase
MLTIPQVISLQQATRALPAADPALRYAAALARATRPGPEAIPLVQRAVRWGAGPRAGQALVLGAKAHALLRGRPAVSPEDIRRVALPVLRHRILPNFTAEAEGITAEKIIAEVLQQVAVPRADIRL